MQTKIKPLDALGNGSALCGACPSVRALSMLIGLYCPDQFQQGHPPTHPLGAPFKLLGT